MKRQLTVPRTPFPAIAAVAACLLVPAVLGLAQRRAIRDQPMPRIVAHEWGVWRIRQGVVDHLADLAAECPAFVIRSPEVPAPPPPPVPGPPIPVVPPPRPMPPPVARKPVLFLYTDRPADVAVRVTLVGGRPWLHYPATTGAGAGGFSTDLAWAGRLTPGTPNVSLPRVARGHWWSDLRAVGAATFVPAAGGSAERFLFYDGPVAFQPAFRIERRGAGANLTALSTEHDVWLVGRAGRFTQYQVGPESQMRPGTAGDGTMLRRALEQALRARGLSAAETRSLLETWRDELFASATPRAIYLVPRQIYDAMLPLTISPTPAETVRVGLVIDEL